MTFGDGTQFGFSEPQGTGTTTTTVGVFGIPGSTQYTTGQVATTVTFTPDIPAIGP